MFIVNSKLVLIAAASVVAVAAAVAIILAIGNSQKSNMFILNEKMEPTINQWDNQSLIGDQVEYRDYWTGNASAIIRIGSNSFDYTAKESGVYEMYFVDTREKQDPITASLVY